MKYEIKIKPSAECQFKKLPVKEQRRVRDVILSLADDPRPTGCEMLSDTKNIWRIRIRDYCIIYTIRKNELIVLVLRIAKRDNAYKKIMRIVKNQ